MLLKEALNELKKEIGSFKIVYDSEIGIIADVYNLNNNKKSIITISKNYIKNNNDNLRWKISDILYNNLIKAKSYFYYKNDNDEHQYDLFKDFFNSKLEDLDMFVFDTFIYDGYIINLPIDVIGYSNSNYFLMKYCINNIIVDDKDYGNILNNKEIEMINMDLENFIE